MNRISLAGTGVWEKDISNREFILISAIKNYFVKLEQWQAAACGFYAIAYAMVIFSTATHSLIHAHDSTPFYSWLFEPYNGSYFVRPLLFGGVGVFAFLKAFTTRPKTIGY